MTGTHTSAAPPPEGGAPFVARRAMNLHGCAPASLCPPFFLLRGYPRECISHGSGACAFRAVFHVRQRTLCWEHLSEQQTE
jgi:hypothetical protein